MTIIAIVEALAVFGVVLVTVAKPCSKQKRSRQGVHSIHQHPTLQRDDASEADRIREKIY
jgi:hypothetical protein